MTEKFKLVKSEPHIENTITGECYDLDFNHFSYIVKIMNDLSNENEQLKQQIENLKITIKARETLIDVCEKKFRELGFIITVDDDGYVIE